jgi:hypothetical protein
MISEFIHQLKTFWNSPTSSEPPKDVFFTGVKVVALFGIFYFAVYDYDEPWEIIKHDLIGFISLAFSLFSAFLIFYAIGEIALKVFKLRLFPTFGYAIFAFFIIYSLMMGFHYLIKFSLYELKDGYFWRLYWRRLPYAYLIYVVYLFWEYKNSIIETLVSQLNVKLEKTERQEIKSDKAESDHTPLSLQVDGINKRFVLEKISHISVNGHYLDIYLQKEEGPEFVSVRKPITEIFEELPKNLFIKIHRSHIININYVSEIKRIKRQYLVKLRDAQCSLPISKSNLSNVLSYIEASV